MEKESGEGMRWKYITIMLDVCDDPQDKLNAAGAQGWELVSALQHPEKVLDATLGYNVESWVVRYILKSPIPASRKEEFDREFRSNW